MTLLVRVAPTLPWALRNGIEKADLIETHPQRFPELTGVAFAPGVRLTPRRRKRLHAIALVVAALVRRCDLRTYRVGDQRDDGLCNGVPLLKLQEHTGLSIWRLSRALADLTAAGYVTSTQPVELYQRDGAEHYRGFPSVRTLSPLLFQRLGVKAGKLAKARGVAAARWKARHAHPASARAILASRAAVRKAARPKRAAVSEYAHGDVARLLAIRAAHPDWPADRVRAEARRADTPF